MEQWNQVEELFLAAAELPSARRAAYLDLHCPADPDLRREVESLLAYDTSNTRPFAPIIEDSAVSMVLGEAMIGRRVGAWRITATLGHGGMGAVFLAIRADAQFEKTAAIKFIRSGLGSESTQAAAIDRFLRERQILANFDHPNIARLIDGGATEEGIPYFVMEYVQGTPIDVWCETRHLNSDQICRLFCKVCDAVSYAHRSLVVHRDLKPTNILVNLSGEPMLLDFGIARLLDQAAGDQTQTALFALTPDYASPEQIRGLARYYRHRCLLPGRHLLPPPDGSAALHGQLHLGSGNRAQRMRTGTPPPVRNRPGSPYQPRPGQHGSHGAPQRG